MGPLILHDSINFRHAPMGPFVLYVLPDHCLTIPSFNAVTYSIKQARHPCHIYPEVIIDLYELQFEFYCYIAYLYDITDMHYSQYF